MRFVTSKMAEAAQVEKEAEEPRPAPTGREARALKWNAGGPPWDELPGAAHKDMYRYKKVSAALRPVGLSWKDEADNARVEIASRSFASSSSGWSVPGETWEAASQGRDAMSHS